MSDRVGDGPPHVDNADAGFQKAVGFVWEVIFDAFDGRLVRLIDVDLSLVFCASVNRVPEDMS